MYSFEDYRKSQEKPKMCVNKNTVYGYIYNNPQFSKFRKIVEHATMRGQLNDDQFHCTLFVPSDENLKHIPHEWFDKMDNGLAKQILAASTLNRKIDKDLVTSSPVSYYTTKNPRARMYITNISGKTRINECASVVGWNINMDNGMIHLVDNIITPTYNTYIN
jgi:uncharacterized surface protein with fasciclin (FAS1) repeats